MIYLWFIGEISQKKHEHHELVRSITNKNHSDIVTLDLRQLHLVISDAVFEKKPGAKTTRHRLAVELLGAHLHDLLAKQGTSTTLQTQVGLVLDNYPLIYNHNL